MAVSNDESGVMDDMNLKLTPGSNDILMNTNPFLEPDLSVTHIRYPFSIETPYLEF